MEAPYAPGRIYLLEVSTLQADPNQPRKYLDPDTLAELTASIRRHGVLEPILFRVDEQGAPVVVAGERRVTAAKAADLLTIPGLFIAGDHREISLVENLLRENLTPIEEAEAMALLMAERSYSQNQLSEMIGKSQPTIALIVSLNRLPAGVKNECRANPAIPRTTLAEIARRKTEKAMRTAFRKELARRRAQEEGPAMVKPARKTAEAVLIQQLEAMDGRLTDLSLAAWKEGDRRDLAIVLRDLRDTAEHLLGIIGPAEAETQQEPEDPNLPGLA